MSKIKTRETAKNIKVLDKAAIASERMRQTAIRAKEKTSALVDNTGNSDNEYAQNKLQYGIEDASREVTHGAVNGAQYAVQRGKEFAKKQRGKKAYTNVQSQSTANARQYEKTQNALRPERYGQTEYSTNTDRRNPQPVTRQNTSQPLSQNHQIMQSRGKKLAVDSAKKSAARQIQAVQKDRSVPEGRIRTPDKTIEQFPRSSGNSTIKGVPKTDRPLPRGREIKTAQQTSKVSVKTADTTAKAAAKAAEDSRKNVQRVRTAAKKAEETAKKAAHAVIASVKAIIQGVKTLVAAIVSGGTVAILAVVITMLIALFVGSCFGIFFSSEEKNDGSERMFNVVREINTEFDNEIDSIKNSVDYDELILSGSHARWQDILAIYAVKTTNDTDNPMEVASVSDVKKNKLRNVFWDMTEIESRTESVASDDGEEIVTIVYLYITVTSKTADEMAVEYAFEGKQMEQLHELMETQYRPLWMSVIYGIKLGGGGGEDIVAVALSQIGNVGGEPYWSWYGFHSRVEWCACFVSWCANECGLIESGAVPKYSSCSWGAEWFQSRGQWMGGGETPEPGMIIFFDWDERGSSGPQDCFADHTGIVERVEDGIIYTVEGNSSDGCRERQYAVGHYEILGYGYY